MSENDAIESFNVKGLDQLLKALKSKPPQARVGILGSTNPRSGKGISNATLGAFHEKPAGMEFGSSNLPQRSFLRIPLYDLLDKEIESSGALDKNVLADVIKSGTVIPWLTKITILAEKIVLGAFDTQGYGKWPSWKNPSYHNNTGMVLVDTQQLRNSITSEVKA